MTLGSDYSLTRFCIQRSLGFVYLIAFLIAFNQFRPLVGEKGLLPVRFFLERVTFRDAPSLFWINSSDHMTASIAAIGAVLAFAAMIGLSDSFGIGVSVTVWFLLWFFYLSFVNVGQVFYGFGWETLLLETGFLAIFLGSKDTPAPTIVIWMLRWVLFRVMFGAGMIKLRADPCWRDLTCMYYHYETQPLPNPLSLYFHRLPLVIHRGSVLFTHFCELIVPWGYLIPGPIGWVAGVITILFQGTLILSGNLSWLNYITIVLAIACFDDRFFSHFFSLPQVKVPMSLPRQIVIGLLTILIVFLSWRPLRNLFAERQLMNASFDPLHLVNTYGAFGSVTRKRYEIILQGTNDSIITPDTQWTDYEFKAKPGDVTRRPAIVSPYHFKLDWQMWFAAMSTYRHHPWILNLIQKLLQGDQAILGLMGKNPFPEAPPRYIRAELYLYNFPKPGESNGQWWVRQYVRDYLPPLSLSDLTR